MEEGTFEPGPRVPVLLMAKAADLNWGHFCPPADLGNIWKQLPGPGGATGIEGAEAKDAAK